MTLPWLRKCRKTLARCGWNRCFCEGPRNYINTIWVFSWPWRQNLSSSWRQAAREPQTLCHYALKVPRRSQTHVDRHLAAEMVMYLLVRSCESIPILVANKKHPTHPAMYWPQYEHQKAHADCHAGCTTKTRGAELSAKEVIAFWYSRHQQPNNAWLLLVNIGKLCLLGVPQSITKFWTKSMSHYHYERAWKIIRFHKYF